jgi:hypothetical protein
MAMLHARFNDHGDSPAEDVVSANETGRNSLSS